MEGTSEVSVATCQTRRDDLSLLRGRDVDVPLCCAVLQVEFDADAGRATDARFVYASEEYCRTISRSVGGVIGRSYLTIGGGDGDEFLEQCQAVVTEGVTYNGFRYDPLVRDWTSYTLAPAALEGGCVLGLIRLTVDERQRQRLMATVEARTSLLISEMLSKLSAEQSYDAAMGRMLEMVSEVIRADRLSVFECSGSSMTNTFERVAEGVEPRVGEVSAVTRGILARWFATLKTDSVVLVPNVSVVERVSPGLYRWLVGCGAHSLMAAPFFIDGEIFGFLGAYNYQIDETVDLNRLFGAISTFIAARIENRQLIDSLRAASRVDTLTGLLNRRGCQEAMAALFARDAGCPCVLAMLDLDDFKRVNDVFGHNAGDEALRAMTRAMRATFPTGTILSRNGGDEFLAVLTGEGARDAEAALAAFTRAGLDFDFGGQRLQLTVSAGYASYPDQADNVRELFSHADSALYSVKLSGKAGFRRYVPSAEEGARVRLGFSARDLLDYAPNPLLVSVADEQADILYANREFAHLLGYASMYDLMRGTGGTYRGVVAPEERERVRDAIDRMDRTSGVGTLEDFRFGVVGKDGGVLAVTASLRFVDIEETGRVLYTYVTSGRG